MSPLSLSMRRGPEDEVFERVLLQKSTHDVKYNTTHNTHKNRSLDINLVNYCLKIQHYAIFYDL